MFDVLQHVANETGSWTVVDPNAARYMPGQPCRARAIANEFCPLHHGVYAGALPGPECCNVGALAALTRQLGDADFMTRNQIIPTYVPGHFLCSYVLHASRSIEFYDPLGQANALNRSEFPNSVNAWMHAERRARGLEARPDYTVRFNSVSFGRRAPRGATLACQNDGVSCALFVAAHGRSVMLTGQRPTTQTLRGIHTRELRLFSLEMFLITVGLPDATVASLTPPVGGNEDVDDPDAVMFMEAS